MTTGIYIEDWQTKGHHRVSIPIKGDQAHGPKRSLSEAPDPKHKNGGQVPPAFEKKPSIEKKTARVDFYLICEETYLPFCIV
jgi:hypothetical protein